MTNQPITLSQVSSDFELIVEQLQQQLQNYPSWADILTSGTGQTILDFIAASTTYDSLAIERAAQEVNLDTARLPSSIYTITRMLGVHITRKIPASLKVTFTNTSSTGLPVTIPSYTQCFVNQTAYFNRTPIIFTSNQTTLNFTLYEGTVNTAVFTSDGTNFQRYLLGNSDFSISDVDITCTVGGNTPFTETILGLWQYTASDNIFYQQTTADGNVECIFGNNIYGVAPTVNSSVTFTYVTTSGLGGNNLINNQTVTINGFSAINGLTTTVPNGGLNQPSASFYQIMAPSIYSARSRAVTRQDFKATAVLYPGVVDALFRGQAEVFPNDKTYMNVTFSTILTNTPLVPWTNLQWNNFVVYMQQYMVDSIQINRVDPTAVHVSISANVFCFKQANLATVQQTLINATQNYYNPKLGSLGLSLFLSDIYSILHDTTTSVDYLDLITPTSDVLVTGLQFLILDSLTINCQYSSRN